MGNFCTRCGKALQEGEICSCQLSERKKEEGTQPISGRQGEEKGQQEAAKGPKGSPGRLGQQAPPQSQFEKQATAFAKSYSKKIWSMIKNPIAAGKEMIMQADMKSSLLLLAFQGIFSAIFVMAAEGRVMSELEISTPYARILITTWLLSAGLACVLALLLKLGNAIIKIPVSYSQMLSAVSIRSIVLIPAIVFSIVVSIVHMGAGIGLFVFINIWGFAAMVVAMSTLIEPEKLSKFVLVVSIVILLFIILAVFILTKTVRFYIPDEIRTFISNINDIGDIISLL